MSYKIAVSGAASGSHVTKAKNKSVKIGQAVAQAGCILITGATSGIPYYAAQGAKKAGGTVIGFSPAATKRDHLKSYRLPLDYHDVVVYTGFDYAGRNLLMTRAADAVIVACGRMGTLNEFTIAYEDRKPIGVLLGSGGTADLIKQLTQRPHKKRGKIIYDTDPKRLVQKLVRYIKKEKRSR